jgi:hypothetical protein
MKRKVKTKAQFDREQEIAREEKRTESVKKYNEEVDSLQISDAVKRKKISVICFGTQEEFVFDKLEKWDAEQPKFPQGKYQDFGEVYVTYQQKFVEVLRDVSPQVFEDLRSLIPNFNVLFGKDIEKYLDVIDDLKLDAFDYNINSPEYKSPDSKYLWGFLKVLFLTTQYKFHLSTSENENSISVPKELEMICEEFEILYKNLGYRKNIYDTHLKHKIEGFERLLQKAFQETATDETLILSNFLELQSQIYFWVDRYHLHKDWLIEYAYFILYQMSKNEDIPVKEIPILKRRYTPDTIADDFVFKSQGWWASKETAEECKAIVREEFEEKLKNYMASAHLYLDLDRKTKFTKPKDPEKLKWLVAWNEGSTIPEIADCFCRSQDTIDDGIDELLKFDLPKRKGKRGRKKHRIVTKERLAEIKALEIGENLL